MWSFYMMQLAEKHAALSRVTPEAADLAWSELYPALVCIHLPVLNQL